MSKKHEELPVILRKIFNDLSEQLIYKKGLEDIFVREVKNENIETITILLNFIYSMHQKNT